MRHNEESKLWAWIEKRRMEEREKMDEVHAHATDELTKWDIFFTNAVRSTPATSHCLRQTGGWRLTPEDKTFLRVNRIGVE